VNFNFIGLCSNISGALGLSAFVGSRVESLALPSNGLD